MYGYRHVVVAVDNSAHSNRAIELGLELARALGTRVTGSHAYAAQLHDLRFKQMEGGLPEKFRKEQELERQRDVHDTLITRGLQIITDSYLDVVDERARTAGIEIARKSLEGKNYRALLDDVAASDYDLIAIGSLGLGAVEESVIGSVCERVVRAADRDVLVAKDPERALADGPIMVAIDGSDWSFAGLKTGIVLARALGVGLEVVSAFDPFFHYVAFHSIAGVLSDEAGEVFRFKEQEQLHEEIIDSGLAKIYRAHLAVADKIAAEDGASIETELLAGKPFRVVLQRIRERNPSLLIVGRRGVHADGGTVLGSNAENLLRLAPCHVLLAAREFAPKIEDIAAETTSWTEEAEQRMSGVPSFARNMARAAILRYAQERGHTVISSAIVDEAVADLLPPSAMQAMGLVAQAAEKRARAQADRAAPTWTDEARRALDDIADASVRDNVRLRAEKRARVEGLDVIPVELVRDDGAGALSWDPDAVARLERVPAGFMRDRSRARVEAYAREQGARAVTLALCEAGLAAARASMEAAMRSDGPVTEATPEPAELAWTDDAIARLEQVPAGFVRDLTRQRIEAFARRIGADSVTVAVIERKYSDWGAGSARVTPTMPWADDAVARIAKIPDFVRGMVVKEVERCAGELGREVVSGDVLDKAIGAWSKHGSFHSENNPDQYDD